MNCQTNKTLQWFSAAWTLLLLVPLFLVIPAAATGLPWRVELFAGFFLAVIGIWQFTQAEKSPSLLYQEEFFLFLAPLTLLALWGAASSFWAQSANSAAHYSFSLAAYLLFYCLVRRTVNDSRFLSVSFYALGAVVWVISLPAVIEYFSTVSKDNTTTLGLRYGKYAELLNVVLPLFFALSLRLKKREFWLCAATTVFAWLLILVSFSRASLGIGFLGICASAFIGFFKSNDLQTRKRLAGVWLILLALAVYSQLPSEKSLNTFTRITSADSNDSSSVRPLFAGVALEMIKANPGLGVGANNYGLFFDEYRASFAAKNPANPNLNVLENELAERAHNEYLQTFAELGLPGGAFLLAFLAGIGFLTWRAFLERKRVSLVGIGALIGVWAFLTSSFVSSYSFRAMQNGLVFFFVLAIAAREILKFDAKTQTGKIRIAPRLATSVAALGIAVCLGLGVLSSMRAASAYYLTQALKQERLENAVGFYDQALFFDRENAAAYYFYGIALLNENRAAEAVPKLSAAIHHGMTATACYSYLATAQTLAGNSEAAEKTMAQAVAVYPRSVFARARYAALLLANNQAETSEKQRKIAFEINEEQARGWWTVITEGAKSAAIKAHNEKNLPTPMDLKPQNALYAYLNEREILYPEERMKF